jgi:hypothetical protein
MNVNSSYMFLRPLSLYMLHFQYSDLFVWITCISSCFLHDYGMMLKHLKREKNGSFI